MTRVTDLNSWYELGNIFNQKQSLTCNDECQNIVSAGITLNYAMQFIEQSTLEKLIAFAKECGIENSIKSYFSGEKINFSEDRAVLHTALRASYKETANLAGKKIADVVQSSLSKMTEISQLIRQKKWVGYNGKSIKNIVNIGIGGSDLAPRMSLEALKPLTDKCLNYYFISDADQSSFNDVINTINLEESLFIVASKSFSTRETLFSAQKAIKLFGDNTIDNHFIAITAKPDKALSLGIKNSIPIWDWVGGRFSLCSAVNLMLMIAIGEKSFMEMLNGAHDMDKHFRTTELKNNMPAMLALLSIVNINFRNINSHSVLVYNSRLKYFPEYLQQLEMESNGKSLNRWGEKISYKTCPIVWGAIGNRAQHAYYQLLAQGTQKVSLDFIFDASRNNQLDDAYGHNKVNILSQGKSTNDWSHIEGKQPLNSITIDKLTPYCLGSLIALYEHKVFVQGIIWQINSFDQFGVESAKKLKVSV